MAAGWSLPVAAGLEFRMVVLMMAQEDSMAGFLRLWRSRRSMAVSQEYRLVALMKAKEELVAALLRLWPSGRSMELR